MDPRTIRFIKHHHVFTLATVSEKGSWSAHCFYAFLPDYQALVFTTDPVTRHGHDMLENPIVSGGIMLETKVIGMIRGIQLTGRSMPVENAAGLDQAVYDDCRKAYLKRFPFALAAKLDLWILYIDYTKMTDNRLGFGKKLEWRRENGG